MMGKRLAYVCSDRGIPIDSTKGASVHLREMGRALTRAGIGTQVFVRRGEADAVAGLRATVCDAGRASGRRFRAAGAKDLSEFVEQGAMLDALEEGGPFDVVLERYSLFGLAGLTYAREHGIPFVVEVNAPLWEEAARFRQLETVELARGTARELFRQADVVLTVSPRLRERVIAEGAGPERVHVLPNGVAPEFVGEGPIAARPRGAGERPLLTFVGSLKPWHGIEFLLDAHRDGALGDAALWIVGEGPLRGVVERAVALDPDRVFYEGSVDHERVAAILRASDAALAPYLEEAPDYFCPLKAYEAMSVGTPLLAAAVPAITHLETEGARVHQFHPGSAASLAAAWERCRADRTQQTFDATRHTWDTRVRQLATVLGTHLRAVEEAAS